MFPHIKKTIKKFVLEEQGTISKKSVIILGLHAALFSASVVAFDEMEASDDAHHTTEVATGGSKPHVACVPNEPDMITHLTVGDVECNEGCSNGYGAGHDSGNAQSHADISVKTNVFTFEEHVVCEHVHDHDSNGNGHVSAAGGCKITIPLDGHINALYLESEGEMINAKHEHSIGDENAVICIGGEEEFWHGPECHASCNP